MRTISKAIFALFIAIPVLFVCKWYYKYLTQCIYLSSGIIYNIGKFTCPDPDAFDEFLNMREVRFIAEALGWVFTLIGISTVVLIIKTIISWI